MAVLGPGITNVIYAVAVFSVPVFARLVRGSTLALKQALYVQAARSIGVSRFKLVMQHILPGALRSRPQLLGLGDGRVLILLAKDREERLWHRLDVRSERPQDAARDRRATRSVIHSDSKTERVSARFAPPVTAQG